MLIRLPTLTLSLLAAAGAGFQAAQAGGPGYSGPCQVPLVWGQNQLPLHWLSAEEREQFDKIAARFSDQRQALEDRAFIAQAEFNALRKGSDTEGTAAKARELAAIRAEIRAFHKLVADELKQAGLGKLFPRHGQGELPGYASAPDSGRVPAAQASQALLGGDAEMDQYYEIVRRYDPRLHALRDRIMQKEAELGALRMNRGADRNALSRTAGELTQLRQERREIVRAMRDELRTAGF